MGRAASRFGADAMINVSPSVHITTGGLFRARVSAVVGGDERYQESARAFWRVIDAWSAAAALRTKVIAELQAIGYSVAI